MDYLSQLVNKIELHSVEGIKECFSNGISPNDLFKGEPLIYELTSEYTRTPGFKDCVKVFVEHGLVFDDKVLLSVLLDDAKKLESFIIDNPGTIHKKYTLRCAYTPLYEATLLHICAEFNHVSCAEVLVKHGADINAKAGIDENGFGGQTPIFHTVNSNRNRSAPIMQMLVEAGADCTVRLDGVHWGKGYPWETVFFDVTPVSYAQFGLMPQVHRTEGDIYANIEFMITASHRKMPRLENVPNRYLQPK